MTRETQQVIAGFIPLLDSAVLVAAAHRGFAEEEGIELKLVRETSWANIRDRIFVGHFDVAHILAPMPIASTLKLTSLAVPMRAPMVLGLGGNAITVSNSLAEMMINAGWDGGIDPSTSGAALASCVKARKDKGSPAFRFGVVHAFSGHAYELRYWLAAAGIDPDVDVDLRVLPPSLMPDALTSGQIDGYCVGEPWNTVSVLGGTGRIVTCKQAIWPDSPEKVLGLTDKWASEHPETLDALLRALSHAADWCAEPRNAQELATILSRPDILGCPLEACLPALSGTMRLGGGVEQAVPNFMRFTGQHQAAPKPAYGYWFYSQMVRWGQARYSEQDLDAVAHIFDPADFCRALDLPLDAQNNAKDMVLSFFDDKPFRADALADYIAAFGK